MFFYGIKYIEFYNIFDIFYKTFTSYLIFRIYKNFNIFSKLLKNKETNKNIEVCSQLTQTDEVLVNTKKNILTQTDENTSLCSQLTQTDEVLVNNEKNNKITNIPSDKNEELTGISSDNIDELTGISSDNIDELTGIPSLSFLNVGNYLYNFIINLFFLSFCTDFVHQV